jgi:ATP-dependent RNA helicase RhlE
MACGSHGIFLSYFRGMTFSDLKITRQFVNALDDLNIHTPTEIQIKAIPPVMSGQDVIGIAQTGTGKTAAYLLPLLQQLKYAQGTDARCLILVPTKELVIQVEKNLASLAKYTDLRWVALYGGVGPKAQISTLQAGVDVIIATPGRFLEIYAKRVLVTKKIKHMVLDECDRMMDMGFWPQLREIQEKIPQKKQQLLFSATFPPKVEHIADNFLLWPTRLEVTPQATPATTVTQYLYETPNIRTKLNLLVHLLSDEPVFTRVLVFVKTREQANVVAAELTRRARGGVEVLHSNKGQNTRLRSVECFRQGLSRILVSTDVSARGLDIEEVSHVINFSVPGHYEDYVHRIGRTGRAFRTGTAITFMDISEVYHIGIIEGIIQQSIERRPIPDAVEVTSTPFSEKQDQLREIDRQKRMRDPEFKGAFHEKKDLRRGIKKKSARSARRKK